MHPTMSMSDLRVMRPWERDQRRANGGRATAEFLAASKGLHPGDVAVALGPVRVSGKSLCGLMRKHGFTIKSLAQTIGTTMKRVRVFREGGLNEAYLIRDWLQAITGTDPGAALDHPAVEMLG